MIKKASLLSLVICFTSILSSSCSFETQSRLAILESTVEVDFPSKLIFNLSVESDVNITDIRLHYAVDRMSLADVTAEAFIELEPDTNIDTKWSWYMKKIGGLPPGSTITYWWTAEDASGDIVETNPVRFQFDDDRYSWRSLTEGKITLYWYEGTQSFAQELMVTAQQELARLVKFTDTELGNPVKIYIYANANDLRGAMIYRQEWTGGIAFPRYGIITIGIAPEMLDWGKRAIAHELSHVVIQKMAFNPYTELPTWLDEGLAMYAEGTLEPAYRYRLYDAVVTQTLISSRSLSSPFSTYFNEAFLSYAQSYSLVEFLINNYGQSKMLELLNIFKQGDICDEALAKIYGFDTDGLDTLWQEYWRHQLDFARPAYGY